MKKTILITCTLTLVSACSSSSGDGDSPDTAGTDGTTATSNTDGSSATDNANATDEWATVVTEYCNKTFECGVDLDADEEDYTNAEECVEQLTSRFEADIRQTSDPAQCAIAQINLARCVNKLPCAAFVEYTSADDYDGECLELEAPDSCSLE